MTTILEILTFAWLVYWAWMAVKLLSRGANHPILYVFLVHLLYCGAPLLLNLLFGRPEYPSLPGINEALDDFPTHMLYCLYVGLCPMVWWKMSHLSSRRPLAKGGTPPVLNSTHVFACLTMLLLPFLYLLKVPDPLWFALHAGSRELWPRIRGLYHVVMAHLTLGSILGGIFLLCMPAVFSIRCLLLHFAWRLLVEW